MNISQQAKERRLQEFLKKQGVSRATMDKQPSETVVQVRDTFLMCVVLA